MIYKKKGWNGKKISEIVSQTEWKDKTVSVTFCFHFSCCPLISLFLFNSLSFSTYFGPLRLFCAPAVLTCHLFCLPGTPSPTSFFHCSFQRTCLPPSVFGSLARAWHCAMVEEGLCPNASWLRDWDFRGLDQRWEVKGQKKELLHQK